MNIPLMGQNQPEAGIPCPECGSKIETTIEALLLKDQFKCPQCGLALTVNRTASQQALASLQELQRAADRVEEVKNQTF